MRFVRTGLVLLVCLVCVCAFVPGNTLKKLERLANNEFVGNKQGCPSDCDAFFGNLTQIQIDLFQTGEVDVFLLGNSCASDCAATIIDTGDCASPDDDFDRATVKALCSKEGENFCAPKILPAELAFAFSVPHDRNALCEAYSEANCCLTEFYGCSFDPEEPSDDAFECGLFTLCGFEPPNSCSEVECEEEIVCDGDLRRCAEAMIGEGEGSLSPELYQLAGSFVNFGFTSSDITAGICGGAHSVLLDAMSTLVAFETVNNLDCGPIFTLFDACSSAGDCGTNQTCVEGVCRDPCGESCGSDCTHGFCDSFVDVSPSSFVGNNASAFERFFKFGCAQDGETFCANLVASAFSQEDSTEFNCTVLQSIGCCAGTIINCFSDFLPVPSRNGCFETLLSCPGVDVFSTCEGVAQECLASGCPVDTSIQCFNDISESVNSTSPECGENFVQVIMQFFELRNSDDFDPSSIESLCTGDCFGTVVNAIGQLGPECDVLFGDSACSKNDHCDDDEICDAQASECQRICTEDNQCGDSQCTELGLCESDQQSAKDIFQGMQFICSTNGTDSCVNIFSVFGDDDEGGDDEGGDDEGPTKKSDISKLLSEFSLEKMVKKVKKSFNKQSEEDEEEDSEGGFFDFPCDQLASFGCCVGNFFQCVGEPGLCPITTLCPGVDFETTCGVTCSSDLDCASDPVSICIGGLFQNAGECLPQIGGILQGLQQFGQLSDDVAALIEFRSQLCENPCFDATIATANFVEDNNCQFIFEDEEDEEDEGPDFGFIARALELQCGVVNNCVSDFIDAISDTQGVCNVTNAVQMFEGLAALRSFDQGTLDVYCEANPICRGRIDISLSALDDECLIMFSPAPCLTTEDHCFPGQVCVDNVCKSEEDIFPTLPSMKDARLLNRAVCSKDEDEQYCFLQIGSCPGCCADTIDQCASWLSDLCPTPPPTKSSEDKDVCDDVVCTVTPTPTAIPTSTVVAGGSVVTFKVIIAISCNLVDVNLVNAIRKTYADKLNVAVSKVLIEVSGCSKKAANSPEFNVKITTNSKSQANTISSAVSNLQPAEIAAGINANVGVAIVSADDIEQQEPEVEEVPTSAASSLTSVLVFLAIALQAIWFL